MDVKQRKALAESILEFAVTDFCNLKCALCSQGSPQQKNKRALRLEELKRFSTLIRPDEFPVIKVSGGEPTLHPAFADICAHLKEFFPNRRFVMASNGFQLEKHLEAIKVFDEIHLSRYPGANEATFDRLMALGLPNVKTFLRKSEAAEEEAYGELLDVYQERNIGKKHIFRHCPYTKVIKVVQDRIYPCCNVFGQSVRQNIDLAEISVPFDENWREGLAAISIEKHCQRCFVPVVTDSRRLLYRWLKSKVRALWPASVS